MTSSNDAVSSMSANRTLAQVLSALALEVPDTDVLLRIVDRVPAAVAIVRGPELRYTLVNEAYAAIPPTTVPMLGRTIAEVFPAIPTEQIAAIERVWRTGEPLSLRQHRSIYASGGRETFWDIEFIPLPATGRTVDGVLIIAQEVTRQVRAERDSEELRTSEARLTIALEAAEVGAWCMRGDSRQFVASHHAAALQGLPAETPFGLDEALAVVHPDDRAMVADRIERAIAGKGTLEVEYRLNPAVRKPAPEQDGERWFVARGRWMPDGTSGVSPEGGRMFGVVRDITARKKADGERERLIARMAADNARFEALVDSMPAGVLVAEAPSGRIIYGNRRIEEILRHKVLPSSDVGNYGEWVGWHPDGSLVAPAQWPLARALKGEVVAGDEYLYRRGCGTTGWIRVSGAPVVDAGGAIIGSVVALYDIDREKRAETALRGSEERVRKVIDSLYSFVCVTTPEGVVVEANRTALDAAGLRSSDVSGRRYEDTWWWSHSPEEQARLRAAIDRAAGGETSRYDAVLRLADRLVTVDFTISPMVDGAGRITHLIPSAIDITGRKQAEQALTNALADKDLLLARQDMLLKEVNHRVKNSLQLVASLLNLQGRQLDDARSRQAFEDAVSRVNAIAQVHEQLYKNDNVRRVEFGTYLRTLCTLYGGGDVAIWTEPVEVPTDSAIPLGLLAVELLTNALKHADSGKAGRPVEISFGRMDGDALRLTVRDHGPGIAPHFLDPRNRRRSDSLGMRLIESLAAQLDAALSVDNLDPGTRWTLVLPAAA
ncbi:PAS domain-containing sensor histidine kinase [Skermanella pratensis]|uniref:PAS domain-containing sensor histidine kinase n=1 Tax=Skermanella pratensis TaxID=2233999 RepID=UPI001301950C|nr:PAS domain-containing protein [Skermanella pratensis]